MTRPALNGGKECPDLIQLGRGNFYLLQIFVLLYELICSISQYILRNV
jgi:hypothetical protein